MTIRAPTRWLLAASIASAVAGCSADVDVVAVGASPDAAIDAAVEPPPSLDARSLADSATSSESAAATDATAIIDASTDAGGSCSASDAICRPDLAAGAFTRALCVCGDLTSAGAVTTDLVGTSSSPQAKASAGIDGALLQSQLVRIGGDLTMSGPSPLSLAGGMQTTGDLRLAAGGHVASVLDVGGDLWLGATLTTAGLATIQGDVHLAPGVMLASFGPAVVGGQTSTAELAVDPPCACGASALDIAGVVSAARSSNDDARLAIEPDALSASSPATHLALDCGTVYLDSIATSGPFGLAIRGHVTLVVAGDVTLPSSFTLDLAAGAELDWFVGGSVSFAAGAGIGDPARPGAIRLYAIGGGPIALPGDSSVSLSLYAPNAAVAVGGLGTVNGALFASSVTAPIGLTVHHDPAAAGEACPGD